MRKTARTLLQHTTVPSFRLLLGWKLGFRLIMD